MEKRRQTVIDTPMAVKVVMMSRKAEEIGGPHLHASHTVL